MPRKSQDGFSIPYGATGSDGVSRVQFRGISCRNQDERTGEPLDMGGGGDSNRNYAPAHALCRSSEMRLRCLLGVVLACLIAAVAAAETVEEKYPDGKLKARYSLDGQRRKQGPYTEYTEKGQKKLTAAYKEGKLNGTLTQYEKGKPLWSQAFKDGQPVYGKTLEQIKKKLAEIDPAPEGKPADPAADREAALRRLKAYRYLVGV